MVRKLAIPILAGIMLLFATYHVVKAQQTPPKSQPPVEPARSPFKRTLAGSGIVEAKTENISIGAHLPGIVAEVTVVVGQKVKPSDVLFRIDDRQMRAEEKMRVANLAAAEAQFARLQAMPRPDRPRPFNRERRL